nr:LPD7 domain-containing protein [Sphingomonas chungangi]
MALATRDRVRSLSEYLVHAEANGVEPGEKAGHISTRNLVGNDLTDWQTEMLAVAHAAPRVRYPMVHIILSWEEDERPTVGQLDDVIDTVLAVAGLKVAKTLGAEHVNTPNPHLHLASLRVDPVTLRVDGSEWLLEDLHQAIAILEERHGWSANPGALYYARDGAVYDAKACRFIDTPDGERRVDPVSEVMVRDADGRFISPRDRRALSHDLMGIREDVRRAAERATNWQQFHRQMNDLDVTYRKKGSGARIHRGDVSAKASAVDDSLALRQLETRWGSFEPDARDHVPAFEAYRDAHKAQLARLRTDRATAQQALDVQTTSRLADTTIAASRSIRQAIRAEHDAAKAAIGVAFALAIKDCTAARFTTAEAWSKAGAPALPPPVASPSLLMPEPGVVERAWSPPASLRAEHVGWATRYYDHADRLVVSDHRNLILVHRPADRDGLDLALTMAAGRWSRVQIRGTDAFKARCADRAAGLGIRLIDEIGTAIVANPARPHTERDPARIALIKSIAEQLDRHRFLPLRVRPGKTSSETAPLFELHVRDGSRSDRDFLTALDRMSEDAEIQSILAKRYRAMLDAARHELTSGSERRPDTNLHDIGTQMVSREPTFRDAVAVARKDPMFEAMLAEVRDFWNRKEHEDREGKALARRERQRIVAAFEPMSGSLGPSVRPAYRLLTTDLAEGRIVLIADPENLRVGLARGASPDNARAVAHDAAGHDMLRQLALALNDWRRYAVLATYEPLPPPGHGTVRDIPIRIDRAPSNKRGGVDGR